uniref:Uncharacterized protein n=1 Tax=Marseillevirus LCMAC101 TaxID=2506602 RepID=A0A481YS19_9VIRU|nr:MAG: hypothetical protein LCMAC101_06480 [Marseillevirus LCMAC101]
MDTNPVVKVFVHWDGWKMTISEEKWEKIKTWSMFFEIKTPYGVLKCNIPGCERNTLDQWRNFISGDEWMIDDMSCLTMRVNLRRCVGTFEFFAGYTASSNNPGYIFEIEDKYITSPLSTAIDEAIEKGLFGEEARDAAKGLCTKRAKSPT